MALAIQKLHSFTKFQVLIVALVFYWWPSQKIFPCDNKFSIITHILFLLDSKYWLLCWYLSSIRNYVLSRVRSITYLYSFTWIHSVWSASFEDDAIFFSCLFLLVGGRGYRLFVLFCFCQNSGIQKVCGFMYGFNSVQFFNTFVFYSRAVM